MTAAFPAEHPIHARVDDLFACHEQRRNTLEYLAGLRISRIVGIEELIAVYLRRAARRDDRDIWFEALVEAVRARHEAEHDRDERQVQKACARVDDALAHLCGEATG